MYVCCCKAVTEAEVRATIAAGAHTRQAVTLACRAGGDCGACQQMIEDMIEDHLEGQSKPGLVPAAALVRKSAA